VDDLSTGRRENLAHLDGGFELVVGDVAEPGGRARAVFGMEAVLHEAAILSVARSIASPLPSHRAARDATS
jgi:UDP-glucose 4-epimerase